MPVCLVKLSAVSFWMSCICGLLTIRTLMDEPPAVDPPPPAPLHAVTPTATSAAAATPATRRELNDVIVFPSHLTDMPWKRASSSQVTTCGTRGAPLGGLDQVLTTFGPRAA